MRDEPPRCNVREREGVGYCEPIHQDEGARFLLATAYVLTAWLCPLFVMDALAEYQEFTAAKPETSTRH